MISRPWEREQTRAERHAQEHGIVFEHIPHFYYVRGRRVPNVTNILAWTGISDFSWVKAVHKERGGLIHRAVHFAMERDLDRGTVDESIRGYVEAAESFVLQADIEVVHAEAVLFNPLGWYCGTADLLSRHRRALRRLIIADWKSSLTLSPATAIQTALYAFGWQTMTGEHVGPRYGVHLRQDGTFLVKEYKDRTDITIGLNAAAIVNCDGHPDCGCRPKAESILRWQFANKVETLSSRREDKERMPLRCAKAWSVLMEEEGHG